MCLIIYTPKGQKIPDNSVLSQAFDHNDDGAGYMFTTNNKLIVRKGFFKLSKLIKTLRRDEKRNPGAPFVIHFRWATHGGKTQQNCHPFKVWPGWAMAHNGVISKMGSNNNWSDTAVFAHTLLKLSTPSQCLDTPEGRQNLALFIGNGNKLVFLSESGRGEIINEAAGVWEDGCWYSNTSWKTPTYSSMNWLDDDYSSKVSGYSSYYNRACFNNKRALPSAYSNGIPKTVEPDDLQKEIKLSELEIERLTEAMQVYADNGDIANAEQCQVQIDELESDILEMQSWEGYNVPDYLNEDIEPTVIS